MASGTPETPTVLRVKRLRTEDPADSFLVRASKRLKVDPEDSEIKVSFRLFCTSKTSRIPVQNILKDKIGVKDESRSSLENLKSKTRARKTKAASERKYKLVRDLRETEMEEHFKLFDVVGEIEGDPLKKESPTPDSIITQNGVEAVVIKESDYVYDFYYPISDDLDLTSAGSILAVESLKFDLEDSDSDDPYRCKDSDDSNDENYFGNEYPDEDDEEPEDYDCFKSGSRSDDDYGLGSRLKIVDSESSDGEYDSFDEYEADLHGVAYAKYKKLLRRNLDSEEETEDEDDQDD